MDNISPLDTTAKLTRHYTETIPDISLDDVKIALFLQRLIAVPKKLESDRRPVTKTYAITLTAWELGLLITLCANPLTGIRVGKN